MPSFSVAGKSSRWFVLDLESHSLGKLVAAIAEDMVCHDSGHLFEGGRAADEGGDELGTEATARVTIGLGRWRRPFRGDGSAGPYPASGWSPGDFPERRRHGALARARCPGAARLVSYGTLSTPGVWSAHCQPGLSVSLRDGLAVFP